MISKYLLGSAITASLILVGCGSGSTDTTTTTSSTDTTTLSSTTGYVVDAAVQNMDYDCVTDNDMNKVTGPDGAFTCKNMSQVRFRIGEMVLGEIHALPEDSYVYPQDILGTTRNNITDTRVTAMAQLLQSLDENDDLNDGIQIADDKKDLLADAGTTFSPEDMDQYMESISIDPARKRTQTEAQEHLRDTMQELNGHQDGEQQNGDKDKNPIDLSQYPMSNLTDAQKYTIAYMWNEEKLAKDIYLELNLIYPTQQLENIATKSETMHQALVEDLVQRYDLNITNLVDYKENYSEEELRAFGPGEFGVQEIQDLYDTLYAEGKQSQQAALEVGCKVEVTDVEDLLDEIKIAEEVNAQDLIAVWNVLLSGSYSHYWAFDKGLKNKGVTDGCCSLGTDYCRPEYPQNENGGNGKKNH
jgi:hypothetical protein